MRDRPGDPVLAEEQRMFLKREDFEDHWQALMPWLYEI
jgi:hypothetical protein